MPPRENLFFMGVLLGALFLLCLAALDVHSAVADSAAAEQARAETRRAIAAAQACAQGEAVVWLDEQTMACRREVRP